MEPILCTYKTAADALKLTTGTISHMVLRGQLRSIGSGRGRRVFTSSVKEWYSWMYDIHPLESPQGVVYLIRSGYHHKIGISKNAEERLKTLQSATPQLLELVHTIPTNNMIAVERMLHRWFDKDRVNGEWFRLRLVDIRLIRACQSFVVQN